MVLEQLNHFEKFNLKTSFLVDTKALEAAYLKLQQQFHPDVASNQTEAEINSILINQAYQILKNPIKRASYLLQLQNINIDSEESLIKPSTKTLMIIMELREEISDNQKDLVKINECKQKIKILIEQEIKQVANFLIENQYQQAAQNLIMVKYLDKIISDLKILL